jgi:hypothetical protein
MVYLKIYVLAWRSPNDTQKNSGILSHDIRHPAGTANGQLSKTILDSHNYNKLSGTTVVVIIIQGGPKV